MCVCVHVHAFERERESLTSASLLPAGSVLGLEAMITPTLRSMMAKLVGPDEKGEATSILPYPVSHYSPPSLTGVMFSFVATVEISCSIVSTVIYNTIYHPSGTVDGRTVRGGFAYWFMAGLWAVAIPFLL